MTTHTCMAGSTSKAIKGHYGRRKLKGLHVQWLFQRLSSIYEIVLKAVDSIQNYQQWKHQ